MLCKFPHFPSSLRRCFSGAASFQKKSLLFSPTRAAPPRNDEALIQSHKLLLQAGFFRRVAPGIFASLPLMRKSIAKLTDIIDQELQSIDCQRVDMPTLLPASLWQQTDRWHTAGDELWRVKDRKENDYCLAPTHEEVFTSIVAQEWNEGESGKPKLPLKLYQITSKFRDEIRPRFGLMRGREFLMKDLYTFDYNEDKAMETYNLICASYKSILDKIGLKKKYCLAKAATGNIGGDYSHEFHVIAKVGEDEVLSCTKCDFVANKELSPAGQGEQHPNNIGCDGILQSQRGIEVGQAFLLGDKYSKVFNLKDDKTNNFIQMGCYGLGVSRILSAIVELSNDKDGICWPPSIAPFSVCIVVASSSSLKLAEEICVSLTKTNLSLHNDVLLDDREEINFKTKLKEAKLIGFPVIVIVGKDSLQLESPTVEIMDRRKNSTTTVLLTEIAMETNKILNS